MRLTVRYRSSDGFERVNVHSIMEANETRRIAEWAMLFVGFGLLMTVLTAITVGM